MAATWRKVTNMTVKEVVERILILRKLGAKNGTSYAGVEKRLLAELGALDVAEAAYELDQYADALSSHPVIEVNRG